MSRHKDDPNFSWGDPWFCDDSGFIRADGVFIGNSLRGDAITCDGPANPRRSSRSGPAPREHPTRPPRASKIPMLFVPPRRN